MRQHLTAALTVWCLGLPATAATVTGPVWSKAAKPINGYCGDAAAPPRRIAAPDGMGEVEYRCINSDQTKYHLRVRIGKSLWQKFRLSKFGPAELLWAPDSKSFFINGSENAYTNYLLYYYRGPDGWRGLDITAEAQRDMVRRFPPCKAVNRDETLCKEIARDPSFNMAGITWTRDGKGLIVFSEVPCSSSYGGIMCAVAGYELSVPDGKILARYSAKQFKAAWQNAMAWEMRNPGPPDYGPPDVSALPRRPARGAGQP